MQDGSPTSTLPPDAIRRAIVLKKAASSSVEFAALIPVRGQPSDSSWVRAEAIQVENDAKGDHLVLWRKGVRHLVYRGDVILPVGTDGFLVIPEELATYLMPAFYRMLHAEGHEPAWVTQEGGCDTTSNHTESDFSTLTPSTEATS